MASWLHNSGRWSNDETCLLLKIWSSQEMQTQLDGTVRDAEIYKKISSMLLDSGYTRNPVQIRGRLKVLKRLYRAEKDKLNASGSGGKIQFKYFQQLDSILGKRDSTLPTGIMENSIPPGFENFDETTKQKWKNLRDSYLKYKRALESTLGKDAKKCLKGPWNRHLKFSDNTVTPSSTTVSISDTQSSDCPSQVTEAHLPQVAEIQQSQLPEACPPELEAPPPSQDAGSSNSLSPESSEKPLPPTKRQIQQSTEDIDKITNYLENKSRSQLDGTDHLFLSYCETFKKFSPKKQALLKIKLATLFACYEMNELDLHTATAVSQHTDP